jgi:hypothetical protein
MWGAGEQSCATWNLHLRARKTGFLLVTAVHIPLTRTGHMIPPNCKEARKWVPYMSMRGKRAVFGGHSVYCIILTCFTDVLVIHSSLKKLLL